MTDTAGGTHAIMNVMPREFWGDLKKAVGAWRVAPLLPLLTLALQIPIQLQTIHPLFMPVGLLLWVFYAGYVGTERLWYLAIWRGQTLPEGIWRTSWRYFPRFFGLGVVSTIVSMVMWIPLVLLISFLGLGSADFRPDLLLTTIVMDVWLTFMTPALAYSTDEMKEAMSIGWRFLKQHWRHCLPYALAPPLASLIFIQRIPETSIAIPARVALFVIGVLAYLALKGATAAYYVRHHGVAIPDDEISVPASARERTA